MKPINRIIWASLGTGVALTSLVGCEDFENPETVVAGNSIATVQLPSSTEENNAVCDPFNPDAGVATGKSGLYANLFYLEGQTAVNANKVSTYMNQGEKVDLDLFFNQLNVPTRPFDRGFSTQNGYTLKNKAGNTLYEYFGLRFDSIFGLSKNDSEGRYQFAILSDDGAVMRIKDSSGERVLIDNDGTHSTQLGCATEALDLSKDSKIPFQLDYYQGPRMHIALMLLWREVPADLQGSALRNYLKDPLCGRAGNDLYFKSQAVPPEPLQAWNDLRNRGWKVVNPSNYTLPGDIQENPCNGDCIVDKFTSPKWNSFTLSHGNVDPSSLNVRVNGTVVPATYDPTLNLVYIPNLGNAESVEIGFCLNETEDNSPNPGDCGDELCDDDGGGVAN